MRRAVYAVFVGVLAACYLLLYEQRFLYASRLWAWFAARDAVTQPFPWFLAQYDKRQENFRGDDDATREAAIEGMRGWS